MSSAVEIVPTIIELVNPRSVVDVGCGVGGWLATFMQHGIQDVAGYDGEWLQLDDLLIPKERFHRHDLCTPLTLDRVFDLAISLEVAEHLRPQAAAGFVQTLARLANVVLFSAAVPFQGGTNHLNEQWPAYWVELFSRHRFVPIDCLRLKFWNNPRVKYWYPQNMMFFVSERHLPDYPALVEASIKANAAGVSLVHPAAWEKRCDPRNLRLRKVIKQRISTIATAIANRFGNRS